MAAIESAFGRAIEASDRLPKIVPSAVERDFFAKYDISKEIQNRYANTAAFFTYMQQKYNESFDLLKKYGKKVNKKAFFATHLELYNEWSAVYPSQKISNVRVLQRKWCAWSDGGLFTLLGNEVKQKNNNCAGRVDAATEQLLLSLYAGCSNLKGKLFANEVWQEYMSFLCGEKEIFDTATGEQFDSRKFKPISDSTVWNWINRQENRRVVDSVRNDRYYNQQTHEPHVVREKPLFSLAKITMDDRDLCRKAIIGNKTAWVHAYYAYDVATGYVLGRAYSLKKDMELVYECFRDMFITLKRNGWKMPAEVEVENHLMSEIRDKLEDTFDFVTFCAPRNSQQKRAEHCNKQKKYYGEFSERRQGSAQGRHYAKHEAYLSTLEKIHDEQNDTYKEGLAAMSFEDVVAEDMRQIEVWNGQFADFAEKQYLELTELNWSNIVENWGYARATSVKRAKSITLNGKGYWLSSVEVINRLNPNNTAVIARYLPLADLSIVNLQSKPHAAHWGDVDEVQIYQDSKFIDTCTHIGKFQEAKILQTEKDKHIEHLQYQYLRRYYEKKKRDKAEKLIGLHVSAAQMSNEEQDAIVVLPPLEDNDDFFFMPEERVSVAKMAVNAM